MSNFLLITLLFLAQSLMVMADLATEEGCSAVKIPDAYDTVFPNGNRNAASHLWFSYVNDVACKDKGATEVTEAHKSYCPISGSPVSASNFWKYSLPKVGSTTEKITGSVLHCCSPCVCDTLDYVRVDTHTVASETLNVLVIADPCVGTNGDHYPEQVEAPDVKCSEGKLHGATFSMGGHPIVGVLFPLAGGEAESVEENCADRPKDASGCYQSGMGEIFRKLACKNGGALDAAVAGCDECVTEVS